MIKELTERKVIYKVELIGSYKGNSNFRITVQEDTLDNLLLIKTIGGYPVRITPWREIEDNDYTEKMKYVMCHRCYAYGHEKENCVFDEGQFMKEAVLQLITK